MNLMAPAATGQVPLGSVWRVGGLLRSSVQSQGHQTSTLTGARRCDDLCELR